MVVGAFGLPNHTKFSMKHRSSFDPKLPVVSVVTVVFNDVENLEDTMKSVLNQTYPNVEYILIDGNSTDGTQDVIKKYEDQLGYWVSEPDKGMFDAMNKGVKHATGDWVLILNSGDYLLNNRVFEEIFKEEMYHKYDILYGSFESEFGSQKVLCKAKENVSWLAWQGMQACHSTMLVHTSIAKSTPYNVTYKHSSDGEFFAHCVAKKCKFKRLDTVIFKVGTQGNSFYNWLPCCLENWKIARAYFPGIKTDWYHFRKIFRQVLKNSAIKIMSSVGIYQLLRIFYRKKLKKYFLSFPENIKPINDE